jgi:hypothetical protein
VFLLQLSQYEQPVTTKSYALQQSQYWFFLIFEQWSPLIQAAICRHSLTSAFSQYPYQKDERAQSVHLPFKLIQPEFSFAYDSFYYALSRLQTIITTYVFSLNSTLVTSLVEWYSKECSPIIYSLYLWSVFCSSCENLVVTSAGLFVFIFKQCGCQFVWMCC